MSAPTFPALRLAQALPLALLGWGLGALLVLGLRWLGQHGLHDPCSGRGLLALLAPLLLGPGGLALVLRPPSWAKFSWAKFSRASFAALGLGLVLASLFPALALGALEMGHLRGQGCAGGYIVISQAGAKARPQKRLHPGERLTLEGRIGGYTQRSHPGPFSLQARSSSADIRVTLPKSAVQAEEGFPIVIEVSPQTPLNIYTLTLQAEQNPQGKAVQATGTLEVSVGR